METTPVTQNFNGCINTFNGHVFNILNPKPEMVDIQDIARGLAYKGHFGGQTPFYFSIAQHSVMVYRLMKYDHIINKDILLAALLHDASEAYIGDMVKPLKVHLSKFCAIEDNIMEVIFKKFGLDIELLKVIKPYDIKAQDMEFSTFFGDVEMVISEDPDESLNNFLDEYFSLTGM